MQFSNAVFVKQSAKSTLSLEQAVTYSSSYYRQFKRHISCQSLTWTKDCAMNVSSQYNAKRLFTKATDTSVAPFPRAQTAASSCKDTQARDARLTMIDVCQDADVPGVCWRVVEERQFSWRFGSHGQPKKSPRSTAKWVEGSFDSDRQREVRRLVWLK